MANMIATILAILAIIAQIGASECGNGVVGQSSPIGLIPTRNSVEFPATVVTKNYIGKGKFPVTMESCGPEPDQHIPVTTSHITTPVQEKPTIRLPANIPPPRVISHTCTCYKTVVTPRVQQQAIATPMFNRCIQPICKPFVPGFQYGGLNCQFPLHICRNVPAVRTVTGCLPGVQVLPGVQFFPGVLPGAPALQAVEASSVHSVHVPAAGAPCGQTVEVAQF